MAYDIGPKIGIEGEAEFRQAINGINTNLKTLGTEMMAVTSQFDKNDKSMESLTAQNKVLNKQIDEQKNKLSELQKGLSAASEKYGENDKVTQGWRQAVNKATADLNKMERELADIENQASKTNIVLTKDDAINNLKKMAEVAAVAGAVVGAAFIGMANAAMSNADELQRQSDVTGLSAERLQELAYAGNNLGVELDIITGAQAKLTKNMYAAVDGTGAQADAFKALGVNVLDNNGQLKSAETVMNETFAALNNVGNETERDAIAMTLFGKSAMEMNPLIKAGGDELARLSEEARNNGAVMSNEAIAGLDTFGDTIDNLKTYVLGTFGEKFAELLPQTQEFLDKLKEMPQWISDNQTKLELIGIALGTVAAGVVAFNVQQLLLNSTTGIWAVIAGNATISTTTLGAAFTFMTGPIGITIAAIGAVIAIGVLLYKNWDTISVKAKELWGNIVQTWENLKNATNVKWNEIRTMISDTVIGLKDDAIEWGSNIVEGFWNGIDNSKEWLYDKITGWSSGIADKIKNFFGIQSPSKLMAEYGRYIDEGLAQGIENNANLPLSALSSIATNMVDNIDQLLKQISDYDNLSDNQRSERQKKYKDQESNFESTYDKEISAYSKLYDVDMSVAKEILKQDLQKSIPQYATGTNFHPGGLAMVGERGTELLNLPRGTQVFNNKETEKMMRPLTLNLNVGTLIADDYGLKQLERKLSGIRVDENFRLGGLYEIK